MHSLDYLQTKESFYWSGDRMSILNIPEYIPSLEWDQSNHSSLVYHECFVMILVGLLVSSI